MLLRVGLYNKTSKCMVYGELGRAPLQASINQNVSIFWAKRVNANDKQFIMSRIYSLTKQV